MFGKLVKLVVGIALIPLCIAVAAALWSVVLGLCPLDAGLLPRPLLALLLGVVLWIIAICVLPEPARTYIFAHELSHVIWAWLTGVRVYSIHVGRDRGSVEIAETNFLIMLAPYFFPLYTVLVLVVYYLGALFLDVHALFLPLLFLVGVTYGFHLTFTIAALQHHQTDVARQGRIFSYTVILLMNLAGIGLWLVAVSDATLVSLGQRVWAEGIRFYGWVPGAGGWLRDALASLRGAL